MVPEKTVAQQEIEGFKKEKVYLDSIPIKSLNLGDFSSITLFLFIQVRIFIAFTDNADGTEKRKPFIGKEKIPSCFKRKSGEQLGFYLRNNKKT